MTREYLTGWKPPTRDHSGENIPELFARWLVDEAVGTICAKRYRFDFPITKGISQLLDEEKVVTDRLERKGAYLHEPDGSIFSDYKNMREEAAFKLGKGIGLVDLEEVGIAGHKLLKAQFSPDMTTEEALDLARREVATWNWSD